MRKPTDPSDSNLAICASSSAIGLHTASFPSRSMMTVMRRGKRPSGITMLPSTDQIPSATRRSGPCGWTIHSLLNLATSRHSLCRMHATRDVKEWARVPPIRSATGRAPGIATSAGFPRATCMRPSSLRASQRRSKSTPITTFAGGAPDRHSSVIETSVGHRNGRVLI